MYVVRSYRSSVIGNVSLLVDSFICLLVVILRCLLMGLSHSWLHSATNNGTAGRLLYENGGMSFAMAHEFVFVS